MFTSFELLDPGEMQPYIPLHDRKRLLIER
jgi:hypothetical protein